MAHASGLPPRTHRPVARRVLAGLLLAASVVAGSGPAARPADGPAGVVVAGAVTGLAGGDRALVRLEGPSTHRATTRFGGRWEVAGVEPGRYRVVPYHARYRFDPHEREVEVSTSPVAGIEFEATRLVEDGADPNHHRGRERR